MAEEIHVGAELLERDGGDLAPLVIGRTVVADFDALGKCQYTLLWDWVDENAKKRGRWSEEALLARFNVIGFMEDPEYLLESLTAWSEMDKTHVVEQPE